MDRAGKKAPPLSGDELKVIFEVVARGEAQEKARQRLSERNRNTVNRAYNVVSEFELRKMETCNDQASTEIAEKVKYGATEHYVQTLFLRWRGWKNLDSARSNETRKARPDPDSALHRRELFYFGQRFRDLVRVPLPHKMLEMTPEECEGAMWEGCPSGGLATPPRDAEEEAVAREWGPGRRDARTHSQFSGFHQHLFGHGCWESLDHVESACHDYGEACRQANEAVVDVVSKRIRGASSNAAESYTDAIARSLLADGLYRKRTGRNLTRPRKEQEADGWLLHLGPQFCRVNSPTEADALAKTYQELRESLLHNAELSAIAKAQEQVEKAMADFRASLRESLLRKLVLSGRCEWCP